MALSDPLDLGAEEWAAFQKDLLHPKPNAKRSETLRNAEKYFGSS